MACCKWRRSSFRSQRSPSMILLLRISPQQQLIIMQSVKELTLITTQVTLHGLLQMAAQQLQIGTFTINDTTAPDITTAAANYNAECEGTDSDNNSGYTAWLAANGGAAASDRNVHHQ